MKLLGTKEVTLILIVELISFNNINVTYNTYSGTELVLNKDRDLALALVISEIERLEVTLILFFFYFNICYFVNNLILWFV